MANSRYDIVIVGSGAGGGTIAHALASSDASVLIVERGDFIPQEPQNWDPEAVLEGPPLSHDRALDRRRWP